MKEPDQRKYKSLNDALTLGINMAVGMAVFSFGGLWLDKKFDTHFLALVGIFLGLFYCGYEVWKVVREMNK